MTWRLLAHETFLARQAEFYDRHPAAANALYTALKATLEDPMGTGAKVLRHVNDERLVGRLFRRHIHGRQGFRLVYLIDSDARLIFPVFLSLVRRNDFAWDSGTEWQELAEEIYDDLVNGAEHKFKQMRF